MLRLALIFFVLAMIRVDAAFGSSQISGFEFHQCNPLGCIDATSNRAFLSGANSALSAPNVKLKIIRKGRSKAQTYDCTSFEYDFRTDFLTCEVSQPNSYALTVDSQLAMHKLNLSHYVPPIFR